MVRDLAALLEQTAPLPQRTVDTAALVTRVRRRRRARQAAAAGASVGVLLVVVLAVSPLVPSDRVEFLGPADGGTSVDPSTAPSQSVGDAVRDGVVPAIAALPLAERLEILERLPAAEGVWVRSRLSESVRERAREDACAIGAFGDPRALDGRDAVCVDEYGEVLLLDGAESRIIRAVPLPGVPAQTVVLGDEAVYCARQGDGGLPDSMLCRIDRTSFAPLVRIFPAAKDSSFGRDTNRWMPRWWVLDDGLEPAPVFEHLDVADDALTLRGSGGTATADPLTLELR
jgi:hypothetical protein